MRKTVGIIGGKGLMGNFFKKIFEKKGFHVLISDKNTQLTNKEVVQKSDIVFFSVPITVTEKVIKEVLPLVKPGQLLLDCTSLKVIPVKTMMKSRGEVIGLHPMFGPSSLGLKNQTVVMCTGRASKETQKMIREFFTSEGAQLITMTAKEHDRLMSIIQVLVHFHTIVLGHTFRKLKVPLKKTLSIASPIYRLELDMIGRIFSQSSLLYGAIEMYNQESKKVTQTLLKETAALAQIIAKKDLKSFERLFKKTADFLGSYKEEASEEINLLLGHLK